MADTFKEVIEVALKATTDPNLRTLLVTLRDLGSSGDLTADQLAGLESTVGELAGSLKAVGDAANDAAKFETLTAEVLAAERQLEELTRTAYQAKTELLGVEKPTRAMQRAFNDATKDVEQLEARLLQERAALSALGASLNAAGVNTERLADEQVRLRSESERSGAALRAQLAAVQAQAEANRTLRARLDEGDAAFRRQAAANRASAEALRAYRERAAEAKAETRGLGEQANATAGVMQRLRGAFAGVLGFITLRGALEGVRNLLGLGDAAEATRIRLAGLFGSQDAGNAAFAELKQLARDNAQQFEVLVEAAAKMKAFGLDPLNGSMQALIDQNARLGGSQQTLEGIILAVGQAWAKQKLQGEEILQLVERGVPVWDLLRKVTGKNVQELQQLAEQGKLGRKEIKQLLDEIGRSSQGAAASNLGLLSSLVQGLRTRVSEFFQLVSESGALQFFKERLATLNAEIDRMARNGALAEFARRTSDAIVTVARAAEGTARFVVEYSGALASLAKTYVAVKAAQATLGLAQLAANWRLVAAETAAAGRAATGATGLFGRMGATIRALPTSLKIGVAVIGLEVLQAAADQIAKFAVGVKEAEASLAASSEANRALFQSQIDTLHRAQAATIQFRDVQVKSAEEVAALTREEVASYRDRLEGAKLYAQQQFAIALRQREITGATRETDAAVQAAGQRLNELRGGWDAIAEGARLASESIEQNISVRALQAVEQLGSLTGSAKSATDQVAQLFQTFDSADVTELGDIALALATVGGHATRAGENVRAGLGAALRELGGEELLRFQGAAQAAFDAFGTGAQQSTVVAETVLEVALDRLGIKGDLLGSRMTQAGRDTVATFTTVAESATATGAQIEAAFKAAIETVASTKEIEALGAALEAAGARGRLSIDQTSRSLAALQARLREVQEAADPLADAFARLGIVSQRELDNAARTAREAFDQIVAGARAGTAATDDVRRAFVAYARAQLEAVGNASAWERAQVEAAIRSRAAALGLKDALDAVGLAGVKAGAEVAAGADRATDALNETATAAQRVAESSDAVADAGGGVVNNFNSISAAAGETAIALDGVSEAFQRAAAAQAGRRTATGGNESTIFKELQRQALELERQVALAREANAEYDETERRVRELRGQFQFLSDDRLRQLAQEQLRLEQNQKRRTDELQRERAALQERRDLVEQEEQSRNDVARAVTSGGIPSSGRPIEVVVRVRNEQTGAAQLIELTQLPEFGEIVTNTVLRALATARGRG